MTEGRAKVSPFIGLSRDIAVHALLIQPLCLEQELLNEHLRFHIEMRFHQRQDFSQDHVPTLVGMNELFGDSIGALLHP